MVSAQDFFKRLLFIYSQPPSSFQQAKAPFAPTSEGRKASQAYQKRKSIGTSYKRAGGGPSTFTAPAPKPKTHDELMIDKAKSSGNAIDESKYSSIGSWQNTKTNAVGDRTYTRTVTGFKNIYNPDGSIDKIPVTYTETKIDYGKNNPNRDLAGTTIYSGDKIPTGTTTSGESFTGKVSDISTKPITTVHGMPTLDTTGRGVQVIIGAGDEEPTITPPTDTPFIGGQMTQLPKDVDLLKHKPKKILEQKKWEKENIFVFGKSESPYQKLGYEIPTGTYDTELDKITSQKETIDTSISTIKSNVTIAEENIKNIDSQISKLGETKPNSRWQFKEGDRLYYRDKAIAYLENRKLENIEITKQSEQIPELESAKFNLWMTETKLEKYKGLGYTMDITDDQYEFGLPKASIVHETLYGTGEKAKAMLASSAFIESPLAIGTLASGAGELITGDVGYTERRKERLAEYSLGLAGSLKESGKIGFAGKVITSGAVVSGVIVPIVTLGTGYAISGISAGASGVPGATATTLGGFGATLGKFGATSLGKVTLLGAKGGMITLGVVGSTTTAISLLRTQAESPYDLPSAIAETGFTIGLAYGSYKAGGKLFKSKLPKTPVVDVDATDVIVEQRAIGQDVSEFKLHGKFNVGKIKAKVTFKGSARKSKDMQVSSGRGDISFKEQGSLFKKITGIGKLKEQYRTFKADATSVKVGSIGKKQLTYSEGTGQLLAGEKGSYGYGFYEPVSSKVLTAFTKLSGKSLKLILRKTGKTDTGRLTQSFEQEGLYHGMFQKGTIKISGKIYTLQEKIVTGLKRTPKPKITEDWGGKARLPFDVKEGSMFYVKQSTGALKIQPETIDYGGILESVGQLVAETVTPKYFISKSSAIASAFSLSVASAKPTITKKVQVKSVDTKLEPVLNLAPISLVAQESKTRTDTRLKSLLSLKTAQDEESLIGTKELTIQGTKTKELEKFDFATLPAFDTAQAQEQKQTVALAQKTKLIFDTIKESIFDPTPVIGIDPITPVTPTPIIWDTTEVRPKKKAKVSRPRKRAYRLPKKRIAIKTILADPFSVQRSQILYGKATTPKVTKKVWEEFQRTGKVKTVEMREAEKKEKSDKIDFDYSSKGGTAKGDKITFDFNFISKKKKKKKAKKGGKK